MTARPLRIVCIGGGPAGLYFAVLMKRADRRHEIRVIERNPPTVTFGFGVVFSDATMAAIAEADSEAYAAIENRLVHWDDIDIYPPDHGPLASGVGDRRPTRIRSTGHGFSGLSRHTLLEALQEQARTLGVVLEFEREVTTLDEFRDYDLVVAADGVNSTVRALLADRIQTRVDIRPNRFVWLGTAKPFPAFTFHFKRDGHGLWRVHAYQYAPGHSTFIVECRDETWRAAGMDRASEAETVHFLEALFADELAGHRLIANKSIWRQFPTIRTEPWWTVVDFGLDPSTRSGHGELAGPRTPGPGLPVVLLGDAAHTAHFSVGSGTRMAMEDAVALRDALVRHRSEDRRSHMVGLPGFSPGARGERPGVSPRARGELPGVSPRARGELPGVRPGARGELPGVSPGARGADAIGDACATYEASRRPAVESLQRAAEASLQWFEDTERYTALPPLQFAFTLLTRSLRITHEDLRVRDPRFLARVDEFVAREAETQTGRRASSAAAPPPMFTPFRLRDLVLENRVVVSPMCQYVAEDGTIGDWQLVHLGSRAMGGAGLVMAEMTDVSREGRISPGCAGLYKDEHVRAWQRVVDFVHRETPAKTGIQLGHAGRKGATRRMWEGDVEPLEEDAWPLLSASPIPYFPDRSPVPREMSSADMERVLADFAASAARALEAGFDLLEIHMAHGYLLASFISPLTNTRRDEYGGCLENRMRFPLDVFDACRKIWPAEKPMSVRISATDWAPGGVDALESVEVARLLKSHGCDIVDVSAGQTVPDQKPVYGRLFQTPFADRIRHEVGIHTMAVGNISSYMDVNTIIAAGRADLCLLARAHLFDPYWTRHAAYMLGWPLAWPDPYKSLENYTPRFEFHFGGGK